MNEKIDRPDPQDERTFGQFRRELERAERTVSRRLELGLRGVIITCVLILLAVSLLLVHSGTGLLIPGADDVTGLDVLSHSEQAQSKHIRIGSYLFVWAVAFAMYMSIIALLTRRWAMAVIAEWSAAVTAVAGLFAIWMRQSRTKPDVEISEGAGLGLFLGCVLVIALAFMWARVVWHRSDDQLRLEELQRQRAFAENEARLEATRALREAAARRLDRRAESPRDRRTREAREKRGAAGDGDAAGSGSGGAGR